MIISAICIFAADRDIESVTDDVIYNKMNTSNESSEPETYSTDVESTCRDYTYVNKKGETVTINSENFSDDVVLVKIKPKFSDYNFTTIDFPEADIKEIDCYVVIKGISYYRLFLTNPSHDNVIKAVEALNKNEYINSADPDYIGHIPEHDQFPINPNDIITVTD